MGKITLITGGTRSGKSALAEKLAGEYESVVYVATAKCTDAEMRWRIQLHQKRRPSSWRTVETDRDIDAIIRAAQEKTILVESVGTLLTNRMMELAIDWDHPDQMLLASFEQDLMQEVSTWVKASEETKSDILFVSEEVGLGMVSPYAMGRTFADILGGINQLIAKKSVYMYCVISGLPLQLKP